MVMNEPLIGQLLVASTVTPSPLYAGGVCLVVHEDDEQTIGVMLNRPMKPNPEAIDALLMHVLDGGPSANGGTSDDSDDGEADEFDFGSQWDPSDGYADPSDDATSWSHESSQAEAEADSKPAGPTNRLTKENLGPAAGEGSDTEISAGESTGSAIGASGPLLHFGGPVSGPVVALHQNANLAEMQSGDGIYVAADRAHLEHLLTDDQDPFRLILGHVRWDNEQLAKEMEAGWWHRVPASPETVFSPAPAMWPRLIRRGTANSLASWIGTEDLVSAARWN